VDLLQVQEVQVIHPLQVQLKVPMVEVLIQERHIPQAVEVQVVVVEQLQLVLLELVVQQEQEVQEHLILF
jgi:hypothetical protein